MTDSSAHRSPTPATEVLVATDVRKSYGTRQALHGLSFTLRAGRVLGLLGPNGAGKTTAIRILTTILEPSSGRFVVDGISSEHPERIRYRIGVLPEGLGFPKQLTGVSYLTFFGQMYGRSEADARQVALSLLSDVGLEGRSDHLIGTYSHGMRQRLGIARALVNDPAVVFLDEPTLGLDPRGQQELLALIRGLARDRGAGVVLCSHLLSEIEGVCDDVVIMNQGEVVARGTLAEVVGQTQSTAGDVLRVRVPQTSVAAAQRVLLTVPHVAHADPLEGSSGWLDVRLVNADDAPEEEVTQRVRNAILASLIAADVPVLGLEVGGGRLQDVFLQLTAESLG